MFDAIRFSSSLEAMNSDHEEEDDEASVPLRFVSVLVDKKLFPCLRTKGKTKKLHQRRRESILVKDKPT